jgi:hypothetical protein
MKSNTADEADGDGTLLERVLEDLARRSAEAVPYVPPPVVRWSAKIIELPRPSWPEDRRRAVADQAMDLALKAQRKLREEW